ncbi:hypothetical protein BBJ28_00003250 [Nothophytophthora sp. Chile5]|nr:hypothetical protein BBJ28_00003250 [Nothophytophthora sp. Chile5]
MQEKQRIFISKDDDLVMFACEVTRAFPAVELTSSDLDALFHATMDRCEAKTQQNQGPTEMDANTSQLRERAFAQPYIGDDVPAQFESYIDDCWKHYSIKLSRALVYPYTTIVQSSGFGKSRLLHELALSTKDAGDPTMKVLYVCVRQGSSAGFPEKTVRWPDALFPFATRGKSDHELQNELSSHLQNVFHNAMCDWESVGEYCFAHFTDSKQGDSTYDKLTRDVKISANRTNQCASFKHRRILVLALDEARWLLKTGQENPTGWFRRLRRALNLANVELAHDYGSFAGIFAVLVDTNSKISNVTPPSTRDPSSREPKTEKSVLFPPFVLTHTMDVFLDADMKQKREEGAVSTSSEFYREFVQRDTEAMRNGLADMGRSLWQQYKIAKGEQHSRDNAWENLLTLAAQKLVGGQAPSKVTKGSPNGLCGVAALLCRLGIRPYSWSPLASRVVADYMAVLSYVSYTHDQFVSSYSSEPILTFGAARVWYEFDIVNSDGSVEVSSRSLLERLILPELATMLRQEVLDTGGIGELVARIVLLLAMDATGVVMKGDRERCYAGEFYSVATFLRTLSGDSTEVKVGENKTDVPPVDDLLAPWEAWKVGFSHFVQLSREPSEKVLWAMLARRAACALPRNFKGIDLLIPIFKDATVSMILIQVKNREDGDSDYPESAVLHTRPGHVFRGDLKETADEDVVRVYMSLRGFEKLQQCFVVDPGDRRSRRLRRFEPEGGGPTPSQPPSTATSPTVVPSLASLAAAEGGTSVPKASTTQPSSSDAATGQPQGIARDALEPSTTTCPSKLKKHPIVLCVRGLGGWDARNKEVCVVSPGVAVQLKALLTPWWKLKTLVDADLDRRGKRFGMKRSKVIEIAVRPLVETVIENKWKHICSTPDGHLGEASQAGGAELGVRSWFEASDETDESEESKRGTKRQELEGKSV